jgi:hypothetical protein
MNSNLPKNPINNKPQYPAGLKRISTTHFYIFVKLRDNQYKTYKPATNQFSIIDYQSFESIEKQYEIMQGYDDTDEGIIRFYIDFKKWNDEIFQQKSIDSKSFFDINSYTMYYNNNCAVIETLYRNSNKDIFDFKKCTDIITYKESLWIENCHNGGLCYCKNGTYEKCYGVDFKGFYPKLLGSKEYDLQIPIKGGSTYKLNSLDENNLKFGFYRVKIECFNPDFLKIFKFSSHNIYTHYSLAYAFKYQTHFNIKIELIMDVEFNAYLYNDNDLRYTNEIFDKWYNRLMILKNKYPKNKLVKHLLSSSWGGVSSKNKIYKKDEELGEFDWDTVDNGSNEYILCECSNDDSNEYNTLIDVKKIYNYQIRLKPFLLSYSRNVMGHIAFNNSFDKIIRIYCDNICYSEKVDCNDKNMFFEEKTSGNINWKNGRKV